MDIESFREKCMSMDGVEEKTPFGKFNRRFESMLVFYVSGHMFCSVDMDDFSYVNVKSTPEEVAELEARYASVGATLNPAMKNWVKVATGGDVPDAKIYELTARAYELVKARYKGKA